MGKLIKWLFGLVLFLAVLIVAAIVVLPMVVDPNDYKGEIVKVVKEQTGRDLEIKQDLKLSVFPWLGIETGGVTLSNPKGFGKKPFAQIKKLDLRVKVMPLLSKRIEVDTLVLNGLHLNLVTNKVGKTNWADLAGEGKKKRKQEKPAKDEGAGMVAFKVEGVQLRNARVNWIDRQSGEKYELKKIRLVTGSLEPGVTVPVKAEFTLESRQPKLELVANLQGNVTASEAFDHYTVAGLQLNLEGKGEGLPKGGMAVGAGADIEMDMAKGVLQVKGLNLDGPEVSLKGNLKVANMNRKPQVNGDLRLGKTNLKKLAALFGTQIETTDPAALKNVSADLKMTHDGKALKIEPLNIQLDDTKLAGYVHLLDPKGPVVRTRLDIDQLNLDRYLPPPSEEEPAEKPEKAAKGNPFKPLRELDLVAEASVGKLTASKLNLEQVKLKVVSKEGVLKADPISADLYKGKFDGEATLDVQGKQPKLHVKEDLTQVQIGPLLKDLTGQDKLLGRGAVHMNLRMTGLREKAIRRSLNGTASFKFQNGAYKGVNLAELVRSGGGLLGGNKSEAAGKDARTDFSEMSGSVKITDGLVNNQDLSAKSPLLRISGKGQVDLKADTVDYLLTTELVASLEGQGGKGGEKLKGVPIPVRIKGKLTDPSYSPDFSGVLKSNLGKEVEKQKQKLEEQLKEKAGGGLGDQLKNVLGR